MIKVPTSSKKMCVHVFLMMQRGEREGSGVWGGREGGGVLSVYGPDQPVHTYSDTGSEDWVKTENCRLKISEHWGFLPEHFIPLMRRKRTWYLFVLGVQLERGVMEGWWLCVVTRFHFRCLTIEFLPLINFWSSSGPHLGKLIKRPRD